MTSALRRVSVVDELTGVLRDRILDGDLTPGTPLRETDLAQAYAVSRHTLRAALRELAVEGLVRIEPNRGASVARLDEADIQGLYELRAALELEAAHLALERHDGRLPREVARCGRPADGDLPGQRPSWHAVAAAHADGARRDRLGRGVATDRGELRGSRRRAAALPRAAAAGLVTRADGHPSRGADRRAGAGRPTRAEAPSAGRRRRGARRGTATVTRRLRAPGCRRARCCRATRSRSRAAVPTRGRAHGEESCPGRAAGGDRIADGAVLKVVLRVQLVELDAARSRPGRR